jgi:hypothetical protein
MKPKFFNVLTPVLLTALVANGQQAEKTLVKSFNMLGNQAVLLDLHGPVEVLEWNQEQLRVQMTITLQNGTEVILKSLVQAGRYNLQAEEKDGEFRVFAPSLEKEVKMRNGLDIGEVVKFQVYAPAKVTVRASADAETTPEAQANSSF